MERVETSEGDPIGIKQVTGGGCLGVYYPDHFLSGALFLLVRKHLSFTMFFHHGDGFKHMGLIDHEMDPLKP